MAQPPPNPPCEFDLALSWARFWNTKPVGFSVHVAMIPQDDREVRNPNPLIFNANDLETNDNELYQNMDRIWKNLAWEGKEQRKRFWEREVHKHARLTPFDDYDFCRRVVDMYERLRPSGDDEGDGLFGLSLLSQAERRNPEWRKISKYHIKGVIEGTFGVRVKVCGTKTSVDRKAAPAGCAYLYEVKVRHDRGGRKRNHPHEWNKVLGDPSIYYILL